MTECNFYPNTNLLTCSFSENMDGERSMAAEKVIHEKLTEIVGESEDFSGLKIAFDLADVNYVSSAFFRICIALAKKVDTGNFSVINTSPFVSKIFKTAGLEQILNVS